MDDYDLRFFGAITSLIRRKYKLAANARLADEALLTSERFADVPSEASGIAIFWVLTEDHEGWLYIFTTRELVIRHLNQAPTVLAYPDIKDWHSNNPFGLGGSVRSSLSVHRSDGAVFTLGNCDFDCLSICAAILLHHHRATEVSAE